MLVCISAESSCVRVERKQQYWVEKLKVLLIYLQLVLKNYFANVVVRFKKREQYTSIIIMYCIRIGCKVSLFVLTLQ